MYLTDFPDLSWIRRQSELNFKSKKDLFGNELRNPGWPNVILNTRSGKTEREGIRGPISLFLNIHGESIVRTEGKEFKVGNYTYTISNHGANYDLILPGAQKTETFNIHFGQQLFDEVSYIFDHNDDELIFAPFENEKSTKGFHTGISMRDPQFNGLLRQIQDLDKDALGYELYESEILVELLAHLFQKNDQRQGQKLLINSQKKSTREELIKKIRFSVDLIHSHFPNPISLDMISREIGLSKFHFLRTFKQVMGMTPNAYLAKIRFDQSFELLTKSNKPFNRLSFEMGFSELPAFTRFITNFSGKTPSEIRSN